MDTIFMNLLNNKTSDPHRILLNLLNKINSKKVINMSLYQTLPPTIQGKKKKSHTKIINFKYHLQQGMKNLNFMMDHIHYQIF